MDKMRRAMLGMKVFRHTVKTTVVLSVFLAGSFGCQTANDATLRSNSPVTESYGAIPSAKVINNAVQDASLVATKSAEEVLGENIANPQEVNEPASISPAIPASGSEYPIDLEKALVLAGVDNPTIALAREAVQASLAEQMAARALLLPTVNIGGNINVHRGAIESAPGVFRDIDREALYVGAGAPAIGAGTVINPGVRITAFLSDALYAPQIASQQVISREFNAVSVQNSLLLNVATQYFALLGAQSRLQAIRQSEKEVEEVAKLNANFARTGQGREGDAERARSEAFLLHIQEQSIEEEVAVAAAELARLLNLDPGVQLRAPQGAVPIIQLIDPLESLESLIQIALRERPELGSRSADIVLNQTRLRQEKTRPFLPFLSVGFSAGGFGGGSDQADSRFGHFSGRNDFDMLAVWSLENLGFGNAAMRNQMRADVMIATVEYQREIDKIRTEVSEAYALSATRRQQLEVARRRIESSQNAFRQDLARSRNLEGRPIEVLNSVTLLSAARQDLIRSLVEYAQAQFQLFVALGRPPIVR